MVVSGHLGLPRFELEEISVQHGFQTRSFLFYIDFLKSTEFGANLLKRLAVDTRVASLDGQMISCGSVASRFDIETLAVWFAWCANSYGEKFANEQLESWLNAEEIEILNSLWVLGVEADESIELNGGYTIQTTSDMPDSDEKEYFGQSRFSLLSRASLPRCAITKRQKMKKLSLSSSTIPLSDEYSLSCKRLYELAWILNAVSGVTCVPYMQTAYRDSTTPTGYFGGSGGGLPMFDVATPMPNKISRESTPLINSIFSHFQLKNENEKARLQIILGRLSQAKRRMQVEDKMLDLGIALEMLLLDDNEKDQLSLQFRLRGSWLAGKSGQDRLKKWSILQEIYNARSSVAHTGALYRGNPSKIEKIRGALPEYFDIAEAIFQKIVVSGTPNWRDLVLGVPEAQS